MSSSPSRRSMALNATSVAAAVACEPASGTITATAGRFDASMTADRRPRRPFRSVAFVLALPYPATVGGAERWVDETARALAGKVDLTVHYMTAPGQEPQAADYNRC